MTTHAYNRAGEPISMHEWLMLAANSRYRDIAVTRIGDVIVYTLWRGIQVDRVGGRRIFETRIIGLPDWGTEVERHKSEWQARDGHERAVDFVSAVTAASN